MPLKIVWRAGVAYLRGTLYGQSIYESTGTRDPKAADEIRIKREGEVTRRHIHGRKATATFAEAAIVYFEQGGDRRFTVPLLKHFGKTALKDITSGVVLAAAKALYPGRNPNTWNRQVFTPVSAIMKAGHAEGLCDYIELKRPSAAVPERANAEPRDFERFLSCGNPRINAACLFLGYTGRRPSEAIALDWQQVHLGRALVTIGKTKNGEPITVHIPPVVVAALANLPHRVGKVFGYKRRRFFYVWKQTATNAGIGLTPHEMGRHTHATWLRRYEGLSVEELMVRCGWKDARSARRYIHIDQQEFTDPVNRLPGAESVQQIRKVK